MTKSAKKNQTATLYDHIKELQTRLTVCMLVLVASSGLVYLFYEQILTILCAPLGDSLYYDTPAGSFSFIMKICLMGALVITIPAIIYNLIMFARPAFADCVSKKQVYLTTLFSTILAIAGGAFAYFIILPGSLKFFSGFQVSGLNALISADNYLGFVTSIIITFIIVFQLPLLIMFIDNVKPLTPAKLLKNEKWVILGSLIVALLVPFTYDLVTSLLISLPIIVLYNISIIGILIRHTRNCNKSKSTAKSPAFKSKHHQPIRPELALDDAALRDFSNELKNLKKNNASVVSHNSHKAKAGSEIRPSTYKPESVEPADWVKERQSRRLAVLNAQVSVFSDVNQH